MHGQSTHQNKIYVKIKFIIGFAYWLCWALFNIWLVTQLVVGFFFCFYIASYLFLFCGCAVLRRIRVENVIEYLICWTLGRRKKNIIYQWACMRVCVPIHFTLIDYRLVIVYRDKKVSVVDFRFNYMEQNRNWNRTILK